MEQLKPGSLCPLLRRECVRLECAWYTQVRGGDPQSGDPVDHWGCAVAWLPLLTLEVAKETRQGAAATESFRNEVAKASRREHTLYAIDLLKRPDPGIALPNGGGQ